MTNEELGRKLDQLAKKRDHVVDVLGKPLLGLTYQMEIDKLLAAHPDYTRNPTASASEPSK